MPKQGPTPSHSVVTHQQEPVHADSLGVDSLQEIQDRP